MDFQKKVGEAFDKIFERVNKDKLAIIDINEKNLDQVKESVHKVLMERL